MGLADLQKTLTDIAEKDMRYYLLSPAGMYVIASDHELGLVMKETIFNLAKTYGIKELEKAGNDMRQGKEGIIPHNRIVDSRRVWLAYAPLANTPGWNLKIGIDEAKVLEPVYAGIKHTILHFLVVFTVVLTVVVAVALWFTEPAKRLAAFAQKLSAGDLDAQIGNVHFAKEITQLAHTFDKMVIDLKSNIEHRIKEETARQAVEEELKVARGIQASLLPHAFPPFPDHREFELFATNEPAEFIAGDFFDFFFIKPNTLAFVIADVSGHGVPAALLMAVTRTIIRSCTTPEHTPREVVSYINRVLSKDNEDTMFVTLFYGHYDVETGDLTYVNAGHDPPYIVRKDGHLQALPATGPLVGAFEKVAYEQQTECLRPGDLLAAFTDGVTEAQSCEDGSMYGVPRLERLLSVIREEPVGKICDRVYDDVAHFAGYECEDDITLLVLRRN
jgi:sigma-B regulation protein RsbU (phosphoserine phosphatase)